MKGGSEPDSKHITPQGHGLGWNKEPSAGEVVMHYLQDAMKRQDPANFNQGEFGVHSPLFGPKTIWYNWSLVKRLNGYIMRLKIRARIDQCNEMINWTNHPITKQKCHRVTLENLRNMATAKIEELQQIYNETEK